VVTGDADPTCPPEVTAVLRNGIPGAEHVLLERCAHLANICRPDAFAAAVRAHVDAHPAVRS
jgi:pimeloyl-ACP methyl ester carboxylesterase